VNEMGEGPSSGRDAARRSTNPGEAQLQLAVVAIRRRRAGEHAETVPIHLESWTTERRSVRV
jgi:hypothetical protein